jgi:hypothetical protein
MVAGWSLPYFLQPRLIPPLFIGEFSLADFLALFIAFFLGM